MARRQSRRRIRRAQGAWRPGSRARGVRGATRVEPAPRRGRADVSGLAGGARWARTVRRAPGRVLRGVREGRRPRQGQPLRRGAAGAHADRLRNARTTEALPAEDPRRHRTVVPGLLGTRRGQRPRQRVDDRGARRRRVGDQRAEGVDVAGALGAVVLRRRAHGEGLEASRGALVPVGAARPAGRRGAPDRPADGRLGVQRGVLRRRAHRRRPGGRRARRWLAGRDGHAHLRTRGVHARAADPLCA